MSGDSLKIVVKEEAPNIQKHGASLRIYGGLDLSHSLGRPSAKSS